MKWQGKLGAITALVMGASSVVLGCSSSGVPSDEHAVLEPGASSVGFRLVPVVGVTVSSLHYLVVRAGSAVPLLEGDLPTPGAGKEFNFTLPIPVGTDYSVSVSGIALERATTTCTGVFGPFDVLPNQAASISMGLSCEDTGNGMGNSGASIELAGCPRLIVDSVLANPASAQISGTIGLVGSAHDLDGKAITYSWSALPVDGGVFAPPNGQASVFTCQSAADVRLTITASNGECESSMSTRVTCRPVP